MLKFEVENQKSKVKSWKFRDRAERCRRKARCQKCTHVKFHCHDDPPRPSDDNDDDGVYDNLGKK